jgi:alpha-1,2-mannosyltransferase
VKAFLEWLLLSLAILQFVHVGLPPGNADLISVQSLAIDLSHNETRFLYPGYGFAQNDEWVAHHEANLRAIGQKDVQPNWCFYPPLIPFVLSPVANTGVHTWRIVWGVIQFGLIIVFAELILRLLVKSGITASPHRVLIYALVFGSAPVARSMELGQTTVLIAVLLWTGIYARFAEKKFVAAIGIGVAVFVKPFLALAEIVSVMRRHIKLMLLSLGVAAIMMIVSVLAVGIPAHAEYVNLLRTLSTSLTAFSGNQSLFAGFLRLFSDFPVTDYGFQFAPGLTLLAKFFAIVVLGVAMYAHWKSPGANVLLSTGLWISAALLALPISWEHHLLFLLPTLACLWTFRWTERGYGVIAAATVLICVSWSAFYAEAGVGRLMASFPLLGNLILFTLLVVVHCRPRAMQRVNV